MLHTRNWWTFFASVGTQPSLKRGLRFSKRWLVTLKNIRFNEMVCRRELAWAMRIVCAQHVMRASSSIFRSSRWVSEQVVIQSDWGPPEMHPRLRWGELWNNTKTKYFKPKHINTIIDALWSYTQTTLGLILYFNHPPHIYDGRECGVWFYVLNMLLNFGTFEYIVIKLYIERREASGVPFFY